MVNEGVLFSEPAPLPEIPKVNPDPDVFEFPPTPELAFLEAPEPLGENDFIVGLPPTPEPSRPTRGMRQRKLRPGDRESDIFPEKLNGAWKDLYLAILRRNANASEAARHVGITSKAVLDARRLDPAFDQLCRDAVDEAVDRLEQEAWRRAADGVEEPVFYKGIAVGSVQKYSDQLLTLLLRAYRPKFRERLQVDVNLVQRLAEELGLSEDEIVQEAEKILKEARTTT